MADVVLDQTERERAELAASRAKFRAALNGSMKVRPIPTGFNPRPETSPAQVQQFAQNLNKPYGL
jgi:hypothetical protein